MNCYYAEIMDIDDELGIKLYGYAFMDKDMFHAKLHARKVAREKGYVPLPSVWRVNKDQYKWMSEKYGAVSPIPLRAEDEAA